MLFAYLDFSSFYPLAPNPFSLIGILNFIFPGVGTIIVCFLHIGNNPEHQGIETPHFLRDITIGLIQMFTATYIIGWI
jgi:hypothetical protein